MSGKKRVFIQFVFDARTGALKQPEKKPIPVVNPRNVLNDLIASRWMQGTKSWFVEDGHPDDISDAIEQHPASYPPALAKRFIEFFTKQGQWVLDPFLGVGSTLVACQATGRNGVGIELYEKYAATARARTPLKVLVGDCQQILPQLTQKFHLCVTSPPYFNILTAKGDHKQKERSTRGLDLYYGKHRDDLGQIADYSQFVQQLATFFTTLQTALVNGGHLVVIIQNPYHKGEVIPLAFDLVQELRKTYRYLGEMIWCQNQKALKPYGYPFVFVPNIHHHYCLVFRKKSTSSE